LIRASISEARAKVVGAEATRGKVDKVKRDRIRGVICMV
jgi:hypothetical protein